MALPDWNLIAAALAALSLAAAFGWYVRSCWRVTRRDYALCLANRSDVETFAGILAPKPLSAHCQSGLVTLDGWLLRRTGRAFGWRSFNICLQGAFAIPVLALCLVWLVIGDGRFLGIPVFPDLSDVWMRAGRLGIVVAFTSSLLLFGARFETMLAALERLMGDLSGAGFRKPAPAGRTPVRIAKNRAGPLAVLGAALMAVIFTMTFAGGVAFAVYLAVKMSITMAFGLGFAIALTFAFGGMFAAAFSALSLAAVYFACLGQPSQSIQPALLLAFFPAIPLSLGMAMFLSGSINLSIVGWMSRLPARTLTAFVLLPGLVVNLIAGALCVSLFVWLAQHAVDIINGFAPLLDGRPLEWRSALPQSNGLTQPDASIWWVRGAALLILAPAISALVFALAGLLFAALPDRARTAALLRQPERLSMQQRTEAARRLTRLDFARAPTRVFAMFLLAPLLVAGSVYVPPQLGAPGFNVFTGSFEQAGAGAFAVQGNRVKAITLR